MKHERIDCRQDARRPTYITGTIKKGGMTNPCWVRDISAGGALVFAEVPLDRGDRVIMSVDDKTFAAYVRWIDYPLAGLQFENGSMVKGTRSGTVSEASTARSLRANLNPPEHGFLGRVQRWFQSD